MKGQLPRAFVVIKTGIDINPVNAFKSITVVPALPKTRSDRILRHTMRGIAEARHEPVLSMIKDAFALTALGKQLRQDP